MASEAIIEQISQAIRQSGYAPDFGSNEMARALMPTLEEAVRAPLLAEIERLREALGDLIEAVQRRTADLGGYDGRFGLNKSIVKARAALAGGSHE